MKLNRDTACRCRHTIKAVSYNPCAKFPAVVPTPSCICAGDAERVPFSDSECRADSFPALEGFCFVDCLPCLAAELYGSEFQKACGIVLDGLGKIDLRQGNGWTFDLIAAFTAAVLFRKRP
jgi:hypothetical protein